MITNEGGKLGRGERTNGGENGVKEEKREEKEKKEGGKEEEVKGE